MKKIFSILLLFILLFNVFGYRIVFSYLEKKSTQNLIAQINSNSFDINNLVEIKTDLNMPYISDKVYEEAYGETIIKGVHYQYVKRKIENNVLYLLCLPNEEKATIAIAKTNIEKNNTESSNDTKKKNSTQKIVKQTQTEYIQYYNLYDDLFCITNTTILPKASNSIIYTLYIINTPEQPPQVIS